MPQAHRFFKQFAPSLEQFSSACRRMAHSSWKYALPCLLLVLFSVPPRLFAQSTFGAPLDQRGHCGRTGHDIRRAR